MSAPHEIIMAPITVYTGPVGETFPEIQATPAGNWATLGTSGNENYAEEGVSIAMNQTVALHRTLGAPGPKKAGRTAEDLIISLILEDLDPDKFLAALNGNTVADTAADADTGGYSTIGLSRHLSVTQYALLVRGPSAYDNENYNMQLEVPVAVVTGSPVLVFTKGEAAGWAMEFTALDDPDASSDDERFGRLLAQSAAPTG